MDLSENAGTEKPCKAVVRNVVADDVNSVVEVEEKCFEPGDRYPRAVFEYYVRTGSVFRVATCDDRVVGYVIASVDNGVCHLVSIAVLPVYRGLGIGRLLAESALEDCKKRGALRAYLEVAVDNTPAISLYRKLGFRVVGVVRGYYSSGKDAYIMYRELM